MGVHVQLGGRYRLVERFGSGGISIVWRGYDEILRRQVAVKVVSPEYATNAGLRAGLYREAKAAAALSHPHIAGVFDYGESESDEGSRCPSW
jgi:serine/threonine-protein kinase